MIKKMPRKQNFWLANDLTLLYWIDFFRCWSEGHCYLGNGYKWFIYLKKSCVATCYQITLNDVASLVVSALECQTRLSTWEICKFVSSNSVLR